MKIALDVHAHLAPLDPRDAAIAGVEWRGEVPFVDGAPIANAQLLRPGELVRWMDAHDVAQAWVSIPPPLYRPQLQEAAAREWTAAVNDGLVRCCAAFGERLAPLLHLPVQFPELAAAIVSEAATRGHTRFAMPTGDAVQATKLSDPRYEPLWPALDAARAFVFLHPARGCDARLDDFNLHNLLGTPTETAIAAAHLAMAGVPLRHRHITFCLAHAGGALPALVGRLERGQQTSAGGKLGAEPLRAAFRRFCVDCMAHDADALELAARTFGADRILFGSDWPFDMGLPHAGAQLEDVSDELRAALCALNARRLFPDLAKG